MSGIKFSFILPCYNVEQYIGRCLDSILNQDIPHSEYEIICVNDCSPDNLSDVVRQYQQEYTNIILIEHTENKTAGGARNTGIDHAHGKYVWFVDPDDKIMPYSLQKLWDEVKESQEDILFFNHDIHTYKGQNIEDHTVVNSEVLTGQDYLHKYFHNNVTKLCSVWRCIMLRDYIAYSGIRYPEIAASQDIVFLWEGICNAKKVRSIDTIHYSLYQRKDSTTGVISRYTARTCFSFTILYPISLYRMINRTNMNSIIRIDLERTLYRAINDNSKTIFLMKYNEKKKFYAQLNLVDEDINIIRLYMNPMTYRLLKTYGNFLVWYTIISLLSLKYKLRILWGGISKKLYKS